MVCHRWIILWWLAAVVVALVTVAEAVEVALELGQLYQ
jgi:hypothetical protein